LNGTQQGGHRQQLAAIARRAMLSRGLAADFPAQVMKETADIKETPPAVSARFRDMGELPWCSIDNDTSEDLDQLTAARAQKDGSVKVFVAIADVDATVSKNTAIDGFAAVNTLSVYTPAIIFPMLPEKLSTDLTSLKFGRERAAVIMEMTVAQTGEVTGGDVYQALVKNKAKLAYNSTAAWLENSAPAPKEVTSVNGLEENIRLQAQTAKKMKWLRRKNGSLSLDTFEINPVFEGDEVKAIEAETHNMAKDIIEDFMIGANGVAARFLVSKNFPSIRRVVRTPKNWGRIVELAHARGFLLPINPDAVPLETFLTEQKQKDPEHFQDLSLSVIKLLGPGEYVMDLPGESAEGHFSLAVKDYTHSTAPNRRYSDLLTQRLLKAAIAGAAVPYKTDELAAYALRCTQKEDDAKKVERQLDKSVAALLLSSMIGMEFDSIVTGASDKGTWVRIMTPHAEGRLMSGEAGLKVGDGARVKLIRTDVENGYIDFAKV
jgi:exoribonuclease-2